MLAATRQRLDLLVRRERLSTEAMFPKTRFVWKPWQIVVGEGGRAYLCLRAAIRLPGAEADTEASFSRPLADLL